MSLKTLKTKVAQLIEKAQSDGESEIFVDLVVNRNVTKLDPSVKKIGSYAFYGCTISPDIDFSNIEQISSFAMQHASGPVDLSLSNVTSLGQACFRSIQTLRSVSLPLMTYIPYTMVSGCKNVKEVYAPLVTTIQESAFSDGCGVEEVDFPNLTVMDGGYHFYNNPNLKKFHFYHSCATRSTTFSGCTGLTDLSVCKGFYHSLYIQSSTKYTAETLHAIIENYADMTGKTAPTFQIGPTNIAKIDEEHKVMLEAKNINYL